jgi:uracil-DNA glycosylase
VEQDHVGEAMDSLYRRYADTPVLARLAQGRALVRGHGLVPAPLMVVGEAPGEQEERSGRPFVGPAGRLLQRLFADAGLPWEYCYVTNVLSWRPPANRTPYPYEVQVSESRLEFEVELVDPQVIVAAGDVAWRGLTRNEAGRFADARFTWHELHGRRLLAVPHPSYLLHIKDPAEYGRWERATVEALRLVLPTGRVTA